MEKLLAFLNAMSPDERTAFAFNCKTSEGYIRKACSAKQKLGAELCVAIERESNSIVTRIDLRPTDWMLIWPELEKQAA